MCGRLNITTPSHELAEALGIVLSEGLEHPRYNLSPTQQIPAILDTAPGELVLARWGLIPGWSKDAKIANKLFNCRSETATEKPSFRAAFKKRRCVIAVDGFYEWQRAGEAKMPHLIRRVDGRPLLFAGLWEDWRDPATGELIRTGTVLTCSPNRLMARLHDRMPCILERMEMDRWFGAEVLEAHQLLRPCRDEILEALPVSSAVNSSRVDTPECARIIGPALAA